jgi:hypothetical protein
MTGIGGYGGNELLAMHCWLCPYPIAVGSVYHGRNGEPPAHLACWQNHNTTTPLKRPDLTRQGLDR